MNLPGVPSVRVRHCGERVGCSGERSEGLVEAAVLQLLDAAVVGIYNLLGGHGWRWCGRHGVEGMCRADAGGAVCCRFVWFLAGRKVAKLCIVGE